jgi:hypothetical protein
MSRMIASSARMSCRGGFGLPATIMMLIVFAILGLVGISLARQEARSQVRATSRDVAFYAAEAGLARGMSNWTVPDTLVPAGTQWLLDSGTLPGGATYRTGVVKLGDGSSIHSLFAVRAEGRAKDGSTKTAGMLVHTRPLENPFRAALEVLDSTYLAGTADIVGFDNIPSVWNGPYCSALDEDKPGVVMSDTSLYERVGAAKVEGVPPLHEDPDTVGFFDLGDITFEELAADADVVLPNGQVMEGNIPEPSYNADGTCNSADPYNWGDPENPGAPCASWFPTIHAKGDLYLKAKQIGQGLLLVEGDLTAEGGFVFYGPVIVKGELIALGGFTFYGGVKAEETDLGAGNAEIYYSACVLQRVLSNSAAARPRPLMERPWFSNR